MVFLLRQICKSQSNYFLPKSYIFDNIFKICVGEKLCTRMGKTSLVKIPSPARAKIQIGIPWDRAACFPPPVDPSQILQLTCGLGNLTRLTRPRSTIQHFNIERCALKKTTNQKLKFEKLHISNGTLCTGCNSLYNLWTVLSTFHFGEKLLQYAGVTHTRKVTHITSSTSTNTEIPK